MDDTRVRLKQEEDERMESGSSALDTDPEDERTSSTTLPYNEELTHKTIQVGDSGVGKTSLLVQFDQGKFIPGSFSATVGIGFTAEQMLQPPRDLLRIKPVRSQNKSRPRLQLLAERQRSCVQTRNYTSLMNTSA
ncbi:ras-related protein Rab-37-like isoform X1 [Solea senegalensis]|uniref:Ras-related protein Rab-37-like isoform X1 n=1 Tax=Solea senegalensis TaxID=28829 RepID=A0AAV6RH65_SOLSE|nr:ras-related protein Rab-37-like isoform X1 [Solea senegalensis]